MHALWKLLQANRQARAVAITGATLVAILAVTVVWLGMSAPSAVQLSGARTTTADTTHTPAPKESPSSALGLTASTPTPAAASTESPTPEPSAPAKVAPVQNAPTVKPAPVVAAPVSVVPAGPSAADIAQVGIVRRQLQADQANLTAELAQINGDLVKSQTWLAVAQSYGDVARTAQLNADLAALNAKRVRSQQALDAVNASLASLPAF